MKTIVVSEATNLEDVIAAAAQDDVVLFREGRAVALLSALTTMTWSGTRGSVTRSFWSRSLAHGSRSRPGRRSAKMI